MHCFLPLSHPVDRSDKRISGPMWTGSVGQTEAMASMTEERALELCGPSTIEDDPVGWTERDFEYERRRVIRSVRHISEESGVIDAPHLILVDELASWLGSGSPPSPSVMAEALRRAGHRAAVAHYGKPAFRTDAPWDVVVGTSREVHPPM
jgi:tRNA G26 N,N-dimethylase Trm1